MLTATITFIALCVGSTVAKAGFSCASLNDIGCKASANANGDCCSECVAKIIADEKAIKGWVDKYTAAHPELSAKQIDLVETPDRLDWGHPDLHNCYCCAGQCWDNAEDNISCQVYQNDTMFKNVKRDVESKPETKLVDVVKALKSADAETLYPELVAAQKHGEAFMHSETNNAKRNVEEYCSNAELGQLKLFIPGFGRRFHCDRVCLANFMSSKAPPTFTYHPSAIGPTHEGGADTFGGEPTAGQPTPVGYTVSTAYTTPRPINIIPIPNGPTAPSGQQSCSKEGEVCGMAGTTKLFCKCKVCGFKGDVCAGTVSSLSTLAAAMAIVAAMLRFW